MGEVREKTEDRQISIVSESTPYPDRVRRFGYAFVLADGVGGENRGEIAAGAAAGTVLRTYYSAENTGRSIQERMAYAFRKADQAVKKEGERYREEKMATTLTMLVVTPDGKKAVLANVGSDVIIKVGRAKTEQLTVTDSWVDEERRKGVLTAEEAVKHPRRNIITNWITASRSSGSRSFNRGIHYNLVDISPGDTLIMYSDGLTEEGVLSVNELVSLTRQARERSVQVKPRKMGAKERPERLVKSGQARMAVGEWIKGVLVSPAARAAYAATTLTTLTALSRGDLFTSAWLTTVLHGTLELVHWLVNRTTSKPPKPKTPQPLRAGGKK